MVNLAKLELVGLYDLGDIDIDVTDGVKCSKLSSDSTKPKVAIAMSHMDSKKIQNLVCGCADKILCQTRKSCSSAENRSITKKLWFALSRLSTITMIPIESDFKA